MPRYVTRGLQIALDLAILSLAYWLSFHIRFEFAIPAAYAERAVLSWPYVLGLELCALLAAGVFRFSWRYVSIRESARIATTVIASSTVLVLLRLTLAERIAMFELPLGVLCSNCFLAFIGLIGIRATRRLYGESQERKRRDGGRKLKRVLLIGAGQAGVLVAREIAARPDLGLQAVGFLDDDKLKIGTYISGLPVLGTTHDIFEIAKRKHIQRALITIANAAGADIRRITMRCREAELETKIIPGIYEIVGERLNLSSIREVAIEDLLGREPVQLDEAQVESSIHGEVVMVTGAGGSIGSELCRQVARYAPRRLLLVERFENALFEIHRELVAAFPDLELVPCIADVTDARRMEQLFVERRPTIVFHAAAHKHVPMMEANPGEALKNNIGGTRVVADLADRFGVARMVLISTDKAVNPTSVMGATKRVAEIYIQTLGQRSKTRFVTVRFGNVLGSNGSVIPIFKEQIARGGPVTITHPDMCRYFMTIPEASQLVVQAGAMGQGGEIFILDMGEPVRILDLARDLITLSGFRPEVDIAIEVSGVRPGEKLFEELSTDGEHADKTKHPKIFIGRIAAPPWDAAHGIDQLFGVVGESQERIRTALQALVPEYRTTASAPSASGRETKPGRVSDTETPSAIAL
jgi:FlaA1/EpsC-like NDP-sugar epimerase